MAPKKSSPVPAKKTRNSKKKSTSFSENRQKKSTLPAKTQTLSTSSQPNSQQPLIYKTNPPTQGSYELSEPLSRWVWWGGLVLIIGFFVLYTLTAARTPVTYADSDEMITVAHQLGVAHPPGYPVYTTLMHGFMQLPIPGSIAFKGHLFSALLHSLTLGFLFWACYRLVAYFQAKYPDLPVFKSEADRWFLGVVSVASLGFSFLFWLYSNIAEKYAFNDCVVASFLALSVYLLTSERQLRRWSVWLVWAGSLGLTLTAHPINWSLIPMAAWVWWCQGLWVGQAKNGSSSERFKITGLIGITTGLSIALVIALLWWLNIQDARISWRFEPTLEGLRSHLMMRDVNPNATSLESQVSGYVRNVDPSGMLKLLPVHARTFVDHFGWLVTFFTLLGLWQWLKRLDRVSIAILLGWGGAGLFMPTYLGWPSDLGSQALAQRLFLLGYLFVPLLVLPSLWLAYGRLVKASRILKQGPVFQFGFMVLVAAIWLGWRGFQIFPQVDLHRFDFNYRFYRQVLTQLPQDSLFACFTDNCFTFMYLQAVEGHRPDVILLPTAYPLVMEQLKKQPNLRGFDYELNPFLTVDYLTWNIGKRPVYVIDMPKMYYDLLGLHYGFTHYVPRGYVNELVREVPQVAALPTQDFTYSKELTQIPVPPLDLMKAWFKATMARIHVFNSVMYEKMGLRNEARAELDQMANLLYGVPRVAASEIEATRREIESSKPQENFSAGSKPQELAEIFKYVDQFIQEGRYPRALQGALGIITIEPLNEAGRLKVAQIYEKMENHKYALIEYRNVLKYHPENEEAKRKVAELTGSQ